MNKNQSENPLFSFSGLERDLDQFESLWQRQSSEPDLSENNEFLTLFAKSIIQLDEHAKLLIKEPRLGKSADLIDYILKTPWGAPFVSKTTLLHAASQFVSQSGDKTLLSQLLKQFDEYKNKCTLPLLPCINQIHKEIHAVGKKAA